MSPSCRNWLRRSSCWHRVAWRGRLHEKLLRCLDLQLCRSVRSSCSVTPGASSASAPSSRAESSSSPHEASKKTSLSYQRGFLFCSMILWLPGGEGCCGEALGALQLVSLQQACRQTTQFLLSALSKFHKSELSACCCR